MVVTRSDFSNDYFTDATKENLIYIKIEPITLTLEVIERIHQGHRAMEMEDKWNILTEENMIRAYRSWTGIETLRAIIIDNKILGISYNKSNFRCDITIEDIKRSFSDVLWYFS